MPVPFIVLKVRSIENVVPSGPLAGKTQKLVNLASPLSLTRQTSFFIYYK